MPFIDKSPLTYKPNSTMALRRFSDDRAPTSDDYRNFTVGDEWLDTSSSDWWKLCDKDKTSGTWRKMAGTGAAAETLTGNAGGAVGPDGVNNIDLLGSNGITATGNPGTNTMTIAPSGGADLLLTVTGDVGGAVGADGANNIDLIGANGVSVTGNPGTNTLTISGGVDQQQVVYVGKHGNDANDGFSIEQAKLTISAAITTATGITPAVIVCEDAGTYSENLAFVPNVSLNAPSATLNGNITLGDNTCIKLHTVTSNTGGLIFKNAGTNHSWIDISRIIATSNANGIISNNGILDGCFCLLEIEDGFGIIDATPPGANLHLSGKDIHITGTGTGIIRVGTGSTEGDIDIIYDDGSGTGLSCTTGELNMDINKIACATCVSTTGGTCNLDAEEIDGVTAYTVGAAGTLNLKVNSLSGSEAVAAGGVANIYKLDTGIATNQTFTITNPETTNTHFNMTNAGIRTLPLQPAFNAYKTVTANNVTGDSTNYVVVGYTERFDIANNFDPVTGIFTAPVDGLYYFVSTISLENLTVAHTSGRFFILAGGTQYEHYNCNPGAIESSTDDLTINGSVFINLTAGQTANTNVTISNGALVVDVQDSITMFSGYLVM